MGKFNYSKMKKTASKDSVPSYGQMLNDYNKDYGNTTNQGAIPNLNGLLDEKRKNKDHDQIHEGLLGEPRSKALEASSGTIEANIEKQGGPISARQHKEGDKHSVMPINVLSEFHDQKYRDAYKKAEGGVDKDTAFWDKFVGDQLSGEKTTVARNVPESGSQLQNEPSRFESFKGLPTEVYTKDQGKLDVSSPKVAPIEGFKAASMQVTALKDADAMLLHIYYKAASEGRDLTEDEQSLVNGINSDKKAILAQITPPAAAANQPVPDPSLNQPEYIDPDPTRPYPGKLESSLQNDTGIPEEQFPSGGNDSIILPDDPVGQMGDMTPEQAQPGQPQPPQVASPIANQEGVANEPGLPQPETPF